MIALVRTRARFHPPSQKYCFRLKSTLHKGNTVKDDGANGVGQRIWKSYNRALEKSPLLVKCSLAAIIFFSSDLATQAILHDKTKGKKSDSKDVNGKTKITFDLERAFSGLAFGVVGTTYLHFWWGFLEKMVEARVPAARYRFANTVTKVVIDQISACPLYLYSYFFITAFLQDKVGKTQLSKVQHLEEGWGISRRAEDAHGHSSEMLWPTLLKHWRLWPMVHTCNFYFIPLQHRVLLQNTVLVGWSGYLSYLSNSPGKIVIKRKKTLRRLDTAVII